MDSNRFSETSVPYAGQPLGKGLFQRPDGEPVFKNYSNMTETEREHLIMRCKDAKNLEQKERAMEELAPDMDFRALAAETGMFSDYKDGMR